MKKLLFIILFLTVLFCRAEAATRTIDSDATNWSADSSWVEGVAPTAADAVVANGSSASITIDTTTCVASTMILTGYTGTMTFTAGQKLTVTTTCTFVAGMTLAGTGTLQLSNTATITSGGLTFPGDIIFDGGTWTLADNWTVTGSVTGQVTSALNGNTMNIGGSLTTTTSITGTTNLILNGTGTWSSSSSNVYVGNNLTINTAGTITIGAIVTFEDGTLTYTAGTVDASTNSSVLNFRDSCTLNTNGINWYDITINAGIADTITLGSNLTCTNNLTVASALEITIAGAFDISCANFIMRAGSAWNMKSSETLSVTNSMQIQAEDFAAATTSTVKAVTGSTAFLLNYSGSAANLNISGGVIFTDVDASGGNPILNYNGGTLTRTTNITNYTGADLGTPDYPDVGNVTEDDTVGGATGTYHEATEAEVQSGVTFGASSALTGSYVGAGTGGGASFFSMN